MFMTTLFEGDPVPPAPGPREDDASSVTMDDLEAIAENRPPWKATTPEAEGLPLFSPTGVAMWLGGMVFVAWYTGVWARLSAWLFE